MCRAFAQENLRKLMALGRLSELSSDLPNTLLFLAVAPVIWQLVVEMNRSADSAEEIVEVDVFVRRMGIFIGKAEAKENGVKPEYSFELLDDGNRTAFSLVQRFLSKPFLQSRNCRLNTGALDRRDSGFPSVQPPYLHVDGLWGNAFDLLLKQFRRPA